MLLLYIVLIWHVNILADDVVLTWLSLMCTLCCMPYCALGVTVDFLGRILSLGISPFPARQKYQLNIS